MTTKKKPKPAVCTRYAVRREDGKWAAISVDPPWCVSFDFAMLYTVRPRVYADEKVVPVRCRALTSAEKNRTRTR